MRRQNEAGLLVDASLKGARGNVAAAWLAASELDPVDLRRAVLRGLERRARACPLVDASQDAEGGSVFVWLDGSRRRRVAV